MDIKNIEKKDGKLTFQVLVDATAFEAAVNKAYLKAKKDIYVPGFRKGKAPRMVIEGMYGASVFYEDAVDALAYEAYQAGVEQAAERVVGDPAITNYNVAEDKSLTIDFETALYPEVTLGEYKGLTAYRKPVKVGAEDVKKEIETIRKRNARIVAVDRAAKEGDTVNIDYDGYLDGTRFEGGKADGHDLKLGSNSFVPGFEEQLIGVKAGEEKDLDVTFPENYHEGLAGKAVVFKVKVNEVKEEQLPDVDDEFAKDVSEFDTLKEFKADLKKEIEKRETTAADEAFHNLLMAKAAGNMTVEIPDAMIDRRVNETVEDYARNCAMQGMSLEQYFGMMGIDEKTFRGYVRPSARNEIHTELLLEKIAEAEKIEISEDEIEAEYKTASETYGMEIEKIKETVSPELIVHDLRLKKAAEVIFSTGIASEEEETKTEGEAPAEEKKPAAKKTTTKKAAPKAETAEGEAPAEEKKPAAKKTTTKKAAPKAEAAEGEAPAEEKKPAAKKTTTKKAAAKTEE